MGSLLGQTSGRLVRSPWHQSDEASSPMSSGRLSGDEQPFWGWHGVEQHDQGAAAVRDLPADSEPPSPSSSHHSQLGFTGHKPGKPAPVKGTTVIATRESRARRSTWLCLDQNGLRTSLHSDKRGIIQKFKLGIPIRDMRLMDPNLLGSETGKILVRDNAIVFSVEHVRVIITAHMAIIPQDGFQHSDLNKRFNTLLQEHIWEAAQEEQARQAAAARRSMDAQLTPHAEGSLDFDDAQSVDQHEIVPLAFELLVLETCLGDISALCTQLSKELESSANAALDALTRAVTKRSLERVRKVKGRHQRLLMRVRTFREELQRFLEDDDDMTKMCLTRKHELERILAASGAQGAPHLPATPSFAPSGGLSLRRSSLAVAREQLGASLQHYHSLGGQSPRRSFSFPAGDADAGALQLLDDESEPVEAVENLLESYFMQVDSAFDRLVNVGEYIQDTEEFVNIGLDSAQNRLIRFEIVLTAGSFAVAIFATVGGILGENLIIPDSIKQDVRQFGYVNLGTLGFCLLVFVLIVGYIRFRRIL